MGDDGAWTFIDWDLAAPGRRAWDLAWALLSFIPLMPEMLRPQLSDDGVGRRIRLFHTAYCLTVPAAAVALANVSPAIAPSAELALAIDDIGNLLAVAVERCLHESARIYRLGGQGHEPWARLLADGHGAIWADAAQYVSERTARWNAAAARHKIS